MENKCIKCLGLVAINQHYSRSSQFNNNMIMIYEFVYISMKYLPFFTFCAWRTTDVCDTDVSGVVVFNIQATCFIKRNHSLHISESFESMQR